MRCAEVSGRGGEVRLCGKGRWRCVNVKGCGGSSVLQGRGEVACWFRGKVKVRLCKGETEAYIEVQGRDGRGGGIGGSYLITG